MPGQLGNEPTVDTTDDRYFAVRDAEGKTIGYSRNCSAPTTYTYYYMPSTGKTYRDYKPMPANGSQAADLPRRSRSTAARSTSSFAASAGSSTATFPSA